MLADLVKTLVGLGRDERTVQVTKVEGRPNEAWMRGPDGKLERLELDKPVRKPTIRTLAAFVAMLKDAAIAKAPEVYHGPDKIVAFLDRADRREQVSLPLELSARAAELVRLSAEPRMFDVRGLVRFLRVDMDCETALVAKFRTIDFKRTGTGKNTVEHGRESFGRAVESSAQGTEDLPEEIPISTPLYRADGLDFRVSIELVVDVIHEQEKILLSVRKDDLALQRQIVDRMVASELRKALGEAVPVFNGNP